MPTTSFIWGVLEPAANPPIGADNLSFYAIVALSQQVTLNPRHTFRADLNVGTGVYESNRRARQDDVFKFNIAGWWLPNHSSWQWGLEFNRDQEVKGRWFDFTQGFNSQYRRQRLAFSGQLAVNPYWAIQGIGSVGMVPTSEDWGVALQIHYRWH